MTYNPDMINLTYKYVKENYDFCWLKSRIKNASKIGNHGTLVVGSSHALNGIDAYCFENAVNCSMHTQDIQLDMSCIESILENCDDGVVVPQKCFIVFGYYIPFQDVSKGTGEYTRRMMEKVYNPIFIDNDEVTWGCFNKVLSEQDREEVRYNAMNIIGSRMNYYSDLMARRPLFHFDGRWAELSMEKKEEYAKRRTEDHNKHLRYKDSYVCNKKTFQRIISILKEHNIRAAIIIPPFTDAYNALIDSEMKSAVRDLIDSVASLIDFVDFNEIDIGFCDEDFVDTDHLNGRGAYKLSMYLAERFGK